MSNNEPKTTYIDDKEPSLSELQKLVGGYIELVSLGDIHIVIDEEGKIKGKPVNEEATQLWMNHESFWGDVIVGDAVVLTGDARLS
jgi:hypothetical protein